MKRRLSAITLVSSGLFASLFAMNSWAASDLYVSPSGKDTNAGTQSAPFLTIARASQAALPGTTVHVAAGTYNVASASSGSGGILTSTSGTATAHVRFLSDSKWGAKIVVSGPGYAWDSRGSYVDIEGFDISGTGRIGILAGGAHLNITNNFIHDLTAGGGCNGSGGAAIDTPGTVGDVVISNNLIRNIAAAYIGTCNTIQGIYIASPANVVINNIVSGVAAVGIQQWHGATSSAIINNTVFHNAEGILIGDGDGGALPGGSQNNYVANNIVYDNTKIGIYEYGSVGANNRYVNNLVYKNPTGVKMISGSVSGTILKDPMFVKYEQDGSGDYHLQASSPAIGQGALTSAPPTDFDGNPRGSTIDIGAYEYVGSTPSPSPSPSPTPTSTATPKPVLSLSASSMNFGSVIVGSSSSAQVLTIKNNGNANLSITSGFVFSSGFSGSGNCYVGTAIAPGASCSVNVVFKPTVVGSYSGSISIASNATSSPVAVSLVGVGASATAPVLSLSASSLNFGYVTIGTTSATQTLTLKNTGNANLSITQAFVFSSGFSGHGNCPVGTLAPGASCYVNIAFTPTSVGAKTGSIQIYTNTSSSPKAVPLYGTGQ